MEALLRSFVLQVQGLEDVFFQILEDTVLGTAVGRQLDGLGTVVGISRGGRSDDDYRTRLRAQIAINKASGTLPEVAEILELVVGNAFEIVEWYPAGLTVRVDGALTASAAEVAGILRASRPAAVRTFLAYTLAPDDETFRFATGDAVEDADSDEPQAFSYSQDGAWAGSTAYVVGQIVTNIDGFTNRDYLCVTSGTSAASGGPTGTGTGIVDGTVVWDYLADTASPAALGGRFADALEA